MSVARVRRFCWVLSWLTLSACQGMVLNPHGEDPSVDTAGPTTPGAGAGLTPPDPQNPSGADGNPVITDPSEPPSDPEVNTPDVPTVPPTDEADPVFSQPDSGAPETTLALDGGTATQQTDAEAQSHCVNEQNEHCGEKARRPHHDAGTFAE